MAFNTDNIGKNCYINISENENIEDSLYGTIIGYYKNTDKNEEYYFVSINGEVKRIYDDSLVNIIEDDSGSVTPGTLIMVSGEMTEEQATQFRENVGAAEAETIVTVSDVDAIITPVANTIYQCGVLTDLAIEDAPATGAYSIVFRSGSTATVTRFPVTILGLEDFAAEANTLYEINVLDNRAVIGSWEVGV